MVQNVDRPVGVPDIPVIISRPGRSAKSRFGIAALIVLTLLFGRPLFDLARFALANDLYSHVLLVPFVMIYLVWLKRADLRRLAPGRRTLFAAFVPAALATLCLALYFAVAPAWRSVPENSLFLLVLSYVCFVWSLILATWGWNVFRAVLFPVAFLIFFAPFPAEFTHAIEIGLQYASAEAASLMFSVSQLPVLRDGLFFKLPGITLEVAQECSGIRSTFVLFITSLVGGYLFFRQKTNRFWLVLAIVPIAIVRNGLRIVTIGFLCVHIGPDMIHSWIHRRGGPVFFALSLIPLGVLLVLLYRRDQGNRKGQSPLPTTPRPGAAVS